MAEQDAIEVWQNERFFGILGWKASHALLDRAEWTDAEGGPVALEPPPSAALEDWEVVVTTGTDDEGWQYGTVFKHLEYKRPGGRSTQRFGDLTRRRRWHRLRMPEHLVDGTVLVEGPGVQPLRQKSETRRRKEQEEAAQRRAVKGFLKMAAELLERQSWWTLAPWDPSAFWTVYQKHQAVYASLEVQAYERRLFTADAEAPRSAMRPTAGRTLLQDLLCAAMHARAAYGYPMAAGHISSISNYIKLKTLMQLTFDAVGGVSVEANNEAVAGLTGIDPDDILLSQWVNSTFRPCHYMAVDRTNGCLVLSIRGSLELGDLLSDLTAHPLEIQLDGTSGLVHEGIFSAATYIHCATAATLAKAAELFPGWPLLVTGHSLGGGVAALLTMLLKQGGAPKDLGPIHCITIGTAAVMSLPLAEACRDHVTSVILAADIVPKLSCASVETLLVEISGSSLLPRAAKGIGKTLSSVLGLSGKPETPPPTKQAWAAVKNAARSPNAYTAEGLAAMLDCEDQDPTAGGVLAESSDPVLEPMHMTGGGDVPGGNAGAQSPRMIPCIEEGPDALLLGDSVVAAVDGDPAAAPSTIDGPESEVLSYLGGLEDVPGACSAVAAEIAAAVESSEPSLTAASEPRPSTPVTNGTQHTPQQLHPEHLYPPGRVIWLFPADEDKSTLQSHPGPDGDSNGACQSTTASNGMAPSTDAHADPQSDGRATPWSTGHASVQEAVREVEAGSGPRSDDVASAAARTGDPRAALGRAVPVAVEATYSSFDRLLLLPDCFQDHIPDRYLQVLQQL